MKDFVVDTPEYEGPLDLLLSIVWKNDLSIANLPLAPITAQYLAYIDQVTALDVNLSVEWVRDGRKAYPLEVGFPAPW